MKILPFKLLFFLILISTNIWSQFKQKPTFTSGKIITKNDTLNCFIEQYVDYNKTYIRYQFEKENKKSKKIESSLIVKIKVGFYNYDRIKTEKSSFLMKSIKKGTISLYNHTIFYNNNYLNDPNNPNNPNNLNSTNYPNNPNYPNNLNNKQNIEKEVLYIVGKGETIKIKKRKFKNEMKFLMSDNLELHSKIDKLKMNSTLFEYNLKEIISKYNYWLKYTKKDAI